LQRCFEKSRIFLLLTTVWLVTMVVAAPVIAAQSGSSETLNVVVAVPRSFPPNYIVGNGNIPSGFAVEGFEYLAQLANLKITYRIFDNWLDVISAVKSGDADLIPNMGISEERKQFLDFSEPLETFDIRFFGLTEVLPGYRTVT
jgi:ABC-type amino acid transport substrate-binding protein